MTLLLAMRIQRFRQQIGLAGLASIALLAAALLLSNFAVKPLQERTQLLKESAARQARKADTSQSGDKVAAVYQFLEKEEQTTDWLAKLHGIGVATGVQLKSASYQTPKTEGRIVRYEIALPVAGSYTQIRDFLKRALAEMPVLSLDSISLKRGEGAIQAELRLTLHMVKS
jgi:Tfp pilus assembly protein PilO